jgi:hypothetical protein
MDSIQNGPSGGPRLSGKPLQAAIAASHDSKIAMSLLEDARISFAFDWSVLKGFFTARDQKILPALKNSRTRYSEKSSGL